MRFSGIITTLRRTKKGSHRSPAERVRWEEEVQRNKRVFAVFGGNEGYGACADEKQDKPLTPLPALWATTSARSAGSLREFSRWSVSAPIHSLFRGRGILVPASSDIARDFAAPYYNLEGL